MTQSKQKASLSEVPRPETPVDAERGTASSTGSGEVEASAELSDGAAVEPVGQDEERSGEDAAPPQTAAAPRRARRPGWLVALLLAAALVVCVLLLLQQLRRAEVLEGRVASLNTELAGARSRLALYEGRMSEVRQSVSELFGQVAGLRDLVDRRLPGEAGEGAGRPSEPSQPEAPAPEPSEPPGTTLPGAGGRPAARL